MLPFAGRTQCVCVCVRACNGIRSSVRFCWMRRAKNNSNFKHRVRVSWANMFEWYPALAKLNCKRIFVFIFSNQLSVLLLVYGPMWSCVVCIHISVRMMADGWTTTMIQTNINCVSVPGAVWMWMWHARHSNGNQIVHICLLARNLYSFLVNISISTLTVIGISFGCLCWLLSIRKFHFGCVDAFRSTSLWQDNYHAHVHTKDGVRVCVCSYDVFFVSAGHMLSSACVTNVADKPRNITIRSFRIYLCVVKKHTKAHTKHITRDRTPWTGLNGWGDDMANVCRNTFTVVAVWVCHTQWTRNSYLCCAGNEIAL